MSVFHFLRARFFTYSGITMGVKIGILLVATLAVYHQDLVILGNEAVKSELMSYILAIPLLLAYLLYRKRKILRAVFPSGTPARKGQVISIWEFIGVLLSFTAFLIYWYGSYTFSSLEYHMLSLPIFVAGCILFLFNLSVLKVLVFPIAFLFFLIPMPTEVVYFLGSTLSTFSSRTAYEFLRATSLPVDFAVSYGTPTIILEKSTSSLVFAIDIACAGIYSLVGFTIFATFVAYIARGSLKKRAAVFLIGFPLLYGLNIIRVVTIVLIGFQYGIEVALDAFHLLGGWILIFMGTLILLVMSEKVFKIQLFSNRRKLSKCDRCSREETSAQRFCPACGKLRNPLEMKMSKRDISKIVVIIVSSILIVSLQAPAFALTEGPAQVTIQTLGSEASTAQILPDISGYTTKFVYRDRDFEGIAQQDASLTYAYMPIDARQQRIWVTLEIAEAKYTLHRWEACLITYRIRAPPVTKLDQKDIQLLQNPPVVGRYFAFRDPQTDVVEVVLYWFEVALFNTGSGIEQKHVKISLIALADSAKDVYNVEDKLLPFGEAVVNYWQPIKKWSELSLAVGQIALNISNHGIPLIMMLTGLLAATFTFQFMKKREKERFNFQVYSKLALKREKLIVRAVHDASKEGKPTSAAIARTYRKLSGKQIDLDVLNEKLEEACEVGLVRKEMSSLEDQPVLIWKSLIRFPS